MARSIGQIEAELTKSIIKFEKEYIGRGPSDARSFFIQDMILIRLQGVLTPAERKLAESSDGKNLVKETRRQLFESSRNLIEEMVNQIVGVEVISLHTDMSSRTGERVVVLTMAENLQEKFGG